MSEHIEDKYSKLTLDDARKLEDEYPGQFKGLVQALAALNRSRMYRVLLKREGVNTQDEKFTPELLKICSYEQRRLIGEAATFLSRQKLS